VAWRILAWVPNMAQDAPEGQGFHAALIRQAVFFHVLKHFPVGPREMLQEIRAGCVDLDQNRP